MREGTVDRRMRKAVNPTVGPSSASKAEVPLATVDQVLAASREELACIWRALHGAAPPWSISQPLLCRILAFDLQLQASGGWPAGLQERIARAGRPTARAPSAPAPLSGGRLLREWNGVTHVVEVTRDGYRWQGKDWRSLSAIARAITGAHWSGPRFFGLGDEAVVGKRGKQAKGTAKTASTARGQAAATQPSPRTPVKRRTRIEV